MPWKESAFLAGSVALERDTPRSEPWLYCSLMSSVLLDAICSLAGALLGPLQKGDLYIEYTAWHIIPAPLCIGFINT